MCAEVLAGQYVTVGGKILEKSNDQFLIHVKCSDDKIHMECFVCSGCKEPIKGKFFKDKDTGNYLCMSCYQVSDLLEYPSAFR